MAKKYLFESSKPESVKRREAAERRERRAAASRRGWETRKAKKAGAPAPTVTPADQKIKSRIKYINQRLRKYGDPDHLVAMLPEAIKTDAGFLSASAEARQFFSGNLHILDQIRAAIRKHPVSNDVRDMFENVLHDIYDQITEIGQQRFFEIVGKDIKDAMTVDADSDAKMMSMIDRWKQAQSAIPAYYEEQIRSGKLTPYTD